MHGPLASTLIFHERIIGVYYYYCRLFVTLSNYVKEVYENDLYHVQQRLIQVVMEIVLQRQITSFVCPEYQCILDALPLLCFKDE